MIIWIHGLGCTDQRGSSQLAGCFCDAKLVCKTNRAASGVSSGSEDAPKSAIGLQKSLCGSTTIADRGTFASLNCQRSGAASFPVGIGSLSPQLTAFFTSAPILAPSATFNSVSAKATGHMAPSSRFASCWKPNAVRSRVAGNFTDLDRAAGRTLTGDRQRRVVVVGQDDPEADDALPGFDVVQRYSNPSAGRTNWTRDNSNGNSG